MRFIWVGLKCTLPLPDFEHRWRAPGYNYCHWPVFSYTTSDRGVESDNVSEKRVNAAPW